MRYPYNVYSFSDSHSSEAILLILFYSPSLFLFRRLPPSDAAYQQPLQPIFGPKHFVLTFR